ncbi:hypothetical protein ACTQ45_13280 [Fundicoccus sp. Sow4_D5]|uniref:hypothetical protein n=1 Tax=Fundicoccus sp. Sow4_D5 TaxID=3438782 RepID=UPI003F8DE827
MANYCNILNNSDGVEAGLLMDTNILIYVDSLINTETRYSYDEIVDELLTNNVNLYITDNVISEYIHRCCKMAYKNFIECRSHLTTENYKYKLDYLQDNNFKIYYHQAIESIQGFLDAGVSLISSSDAHIMSALENVRMKDFNDNLLLNIAECKNLGILTHDKDFVNVNTRVKIYRSGCI